MATSCPLNCVPKRVIVAVMLFLATWCCYMLRVNMSVTIIAMVFPQKKGEQVAEPPPDFGARYNWSEAVQGTILASYGYGYIFTQILGGVLAELIGVRIVIAVCLLLMSLLTALVPIAATIHYGAVVAVRVLIGLAGGALFPALHAGVSKWAPPQERSKFVGALLGGTLGTVVTFPLCSIIIEGWSWEASYYIFAVIGGVLTVIWWFTVYDTPEKHPFISEEELEFIMTSKGAAKKTAKVLPMLKALTSIPFIVLIILHFGNLWGLFFLLTMGPKFFADALEFDIKKSGVVSSLPYLGRFIFGLVFGAIADHIIAHEVMSKTVTRKLFTILSHVIPGCFLILMCFSGHNVTLAVIALTLSLSLNGAATVTNLANHHDLAPNFAGTLFGIMNTVGSTTSFIAPQVTGLVLEKENTFRQWQIVFFIGSAFYIGSGILFCFFGSTKEQSWNNPEVPAN